MDKHIKLGRLYPDEQKKSKHNEWFSCHSKINSCPCETFKNVKTVVKNFCTHWSLAKWLMSISLDTPKNKYYVNRFFPQNILVFILSVSSLSTIQWNGHKFWIYDKKIFLIRSNYESCFHYITFLMNLNWVHKRTVKGLKYCAT